MITRLRKTAAPVKGESLWRPGSGQNVWGRSLKSWEVCLVKERDKKYEAADGKLLAMELKEEEGISLRAMKDGKRCFSYTFEKGEKAVSGLVGNITALMPFLDADPCDVFPPGDGHYPDLDLYDEAGLRTADR